MGHTQNSCGTISMKKHGTWCIAHLGVNFRNKVIPLLDCLKINILLFSFILGYPGEK